MKVYNSSESLQKQKRSSQSQRLLVCNLHVIQRVGKDRKRGQNERQRQCQLRQRPGAVQQAAHHGVLPEAGAEADHNGRQVHAAAQEPALCREPRGPGSSPRWAAPSVGKPLTHVVCRYLRE